tara:strand:+ start:5110 stop:5451 length:342 start_codon:yes stop_codon:yes gene_type:complete
MINGAIENLQLPDNITRVTQWHYDRNLIDGASDKAQLIKLQEEVDELAASISNNTTPIDDIGDIIVVLINIAERNGLSINDCLAHAYNDIKDRKGKMVDGIFVKESKQQQQLF